MARCRITYRRVYGSSTLSALAPIDDDSPLGNAKLSDARATDSIGLSLGFGVSYHYLIGALGNFSERRSLP